MNANARRNDISYQVRVRRAAQQLSGCNCAPRSGLSGYRVVKQLHGYKVITGVRNGLSGMGAPERVAALIPVSDRSAIANAVKLFTGRRTLGDTERVQSAASYASTGATVGSIIPLVGTVIGAAIGALAGWILGGAKPVRASAQQIAECQTLITEYMGYAAQMPGVPMPVELPQLKQAVWCGDALYGAMVKLKDPRFFAGGFDEQVGILRQICRKVYETPVGATVELSGLSFRDAKGKQINLPGMSFINQPFISIQDLCDRVVIPLQIKNCEPWGGAQCAGFFAIPFIRRIWMDLLGYAARVELPNISEADLKAASTVAATIPNASAKDVVSAVEAIIKRPVVREETAALLTPQAPPGSTSAPVAPIPTEAIAPLIPPKPVQATPLPSDGGVYTALPVPVPSVPTGFPSVTGPDAMTQLMQSLIGQGMPPAQAQQVAAQQLAPTTAGLGGNSLWIAGALGVAAVLFATARPAARRTSRK